MNRTSNKPTARTKPALREFAIWRANGESYVVQGANLLDVARRWKDPQAGAEAIAIIDRAHMVRPEEVKYPFVFGVSAKSRST